MQEYPIHYKNTTKVSSIRHFATIYDDQISLSSFYPKAELIIESIDLNDDVVNIYAHGSLDYGTCPYCGSRSRKVHSVSFPKKRLTRFLLSKLTIPFLYGFS